MAGGALKRTADGRWVHVACIWWFPELCFGDTARMEQPDGLELLHPRRWKLRCFICRRVDGACIQCTHGACGRSFHVSCALVSGVHMTVVEHLGVLQHTILCSKHQPPKSDTVVTADRPCADFAKTDGEDLLMQARRSNTSIAWLEAQADMDDCHVCGGADSLENNRIIYCDQCNVGVHQTVTRCPTKNESMVANS